MNNPSQKRGWDLMVNAPQEGPRPVRFQYRNTDYWSSGSCIRASYGLRLFSVMGENVVLLGGKLIVACRHAAK
jgi:hypothetical protein